MARPKQAARRSTAGSNSHANARWGRPGPVSPPSEPRVFQPPRQPPRFILPRNRPRPGTFFPFQRLPLELRLKIWQTCFPRPRKVRLDLGVLNSTPTKLPCTLFINQESRKETLQQYTIVFPTDIFEYTSGPITPPFCFNPRTDSLFCNAGAIVSEEMSKTFPLWLEYLGKYLSGGLDSIIFLRISYADALSTRVPVIPGPYVPASYVYSGSTGIEDMLLKLGGLKTLAVEGVRDQILAEIEQRLNSCLQNNKDKFICGKRPNLTIASFSWT